MEAQTLDDNGDELVSRRRTGTDSADCMIKDAPPLAVFKLPWDECVEKYRKYREPHERQLLLCLQHQTYMGVGLLFTINFINEWDINITIHHQ